MHMKIHHQRLCAKAKSGHDKTPPNITQGQIKHQTPPKSDDTAQSDVADKPHQFSPQCGICSKINAMTMPTHADKVSMVANIHRPTPMLI